LPKAGKAKSVDTQHIQLGLTLVTQYQASPDARWSLAEASLRSDFLFILAKGSKGLSMYYIHIKTGVELSRYQNRYKKKPSRFEKASCLFGGYLLSLLLVAVASNQIEIGSIRKVR
jgi:hypothetical protein